jgi:hypothetical protein
MKEIRSLIIPAAGLLMFCALAVTGVKGQSVDSANFTGQFTLPFTAQWGPVSLPPGEYELNYGRMSNAGPKMVQIRGRGELPQVVILPMTRGDAKGAENALICVREGNKGYVRALELSAIGESAHFKLPHGVKVESKLVAKHANDSSNAQFAEVRIPIKPAQ